MAHAVLADISVDMMLFVVIAIMLCWQIEISFFPEKACGISLSTPSTTYLPSKRLGTRSKLPLHNQPRRIPSLPMFIRKYYNGNSQDASYHNPLCNMTA